MAQSSLSVQVAPGEEEIEKLLDQVLDEYNLVSAATPVSPPDQIEEIYKTYERPGSREVPESPSYNNPSNRLRPLPRPPPQSDTSSHEISNSPDHSRYQNSISPIPPANNSYNRPSDIYAGIPPPPPIPSQNNNNWRSNTTSGPRPLPQAPDNFSADSFSDGQRIYHLPSDPKHRTTTGGINSRSTTVHSTISRSSTSTSSL